MTNYSWLIDVQYWNDPLRNVFFPHLLPIVLDLHNNFWVKIIADTANGLIDTTKYTWADVKYININNNYDDNLMSSLNYYLDNLDKSNKITRNDQLLLDNLLNVHFIHPADIYYELTSYKYSYVLDHIFKKRLWLSAYYPIVSLDNYTIYLPPYNEITDLIELKWDDENDYDGLTNPFDEFRYEFLSRHYTDNKNYTYTYLPSRTLEHHDFVQGQCVTTTVNWLSNKNEWVNHPCGIYLLMYEKWGLADGIIKFWHSWFTLSFYPTWTYYYWGLPGEPYIEVHPCDTFLPSFWEKGYAGQIQDFFDIQDLDNEFNYYSRHYNNRGWLKDIYLEKQFKDKIWDDVTQKWYWPKDSK